MPDYRRFYADGGTYFLTVCLSDRRSDLIVRAIDDLRASWLDVVSARPLETVAAVALPDHLHLMWRLPGDDHDFPARLSMLKAGFTRRLPEAEKRAGRKGERGVWQSRYWEHLIRDEVDFMRRIDYIHWNPVKHGCAPSPDDWPHSTWRRWKKEVGRPISIPPDEWKPSHLGER